VRAPFPRKRPVKTEQEDCTVVITISSQFGAGEITFGKSIAKRLGYTFADREIIQRIAREANVSANWVESFEQEAGSKVSRMISRMVSQPKVEQVLRDERGYLDEQIYLDYLVLIVSQAADEGNVVIMGRGSQYILKGHPETRHILLVDAFQNRVKFTMADRKITEKQAVRLVTNEDQRRAALYRRLGKQDYESPLLYHLVLNMGGIDQSTAIDIVVELMEGTAVH